MKLNGVALGDYFDIKGEPRKLTAVHLRKVGYHTRPDKMDWAYYNEIKPIPLSKEILEKYCTFCFTRYNVSYYRLPAKDKEPWDTVAWYEDEKCLRFLIGAECTFDTFFVHEFQRVLRSLSLTKEFEL